MIFTGKRSSANYFYVEYDMMSWLKNIFAPMPPSTDADSVESIDMEEEKSPFVWNEHIRIVLAMVVVVISAFVMWWILI